MPIHQEPGLSVVLTGGPGPSTDGIRKLYISADREFGLKPVNVKFNATSVSRWKRNPLQSRSGESTP